MLSLYRLLVRLLPADFRRDYGDEICGVVERHWRTVRRHVGPLGALRFWARQSLAIVRAAVTSRRERGLGRRRRLRARRPDPIRPGSGPPSPRRAPRRHHEAPRETEIMNALLYDLRTSLRSLLKRPGFAVITILTLALGIGATTAVFSAVYGVLLRPLPYPDADRIVTIFHVDTETGERSEGMSAINARDLGESAETLDAIAIADPYSLDLQVNGRAESLRAWSVTRGFFEVAGIDAALGRTFTADEYAPGTAPVVLLSHATWRSRFGADRNLVGEPLMLDGEPMTVVGVLPPGFGLPEDAELWIPRSFTERDARNRAADYLIGLGRLAPGAGLEQARDEAERIAAALAEAHPRTMASTTFRVEPLRAHLVAQVQGPLLVLLAAVGFVLLIACANVAGLLLARGAERQREYALRSALGASAGRLVRQIGTESLLLAGLGCVLGVGLAHLGVQGIRTLGPDHLPRLDAILIDRTVLAFAVGVAGLSALLAGLVPALQLARPDLRDSLGDGGRAATAGASGKSLRNGLVVAEVAAAMILLVAAGLLVRSFATLIERDLGFASSDRLALQVFAYGYGEDGGMTRSEFIGRTLEELEAIPGVRRAALTSNLPSATDGVLASIDVDLPFAIVDRPAPAGGQEPRTLVTTVSEGYFDLMEMEIRSGRGFTAADDEQAPPVVVVNETFARRHFPRTDPLGERISIGLDERTPREIAGVVGDVLPWGHESEPRPEIYFPLRQEEAGSLTFVVHTEVEAASIAEAAREAVWRVNPAQSIWGVATIEELLGDWLEQRRFNLSLLGSFALIALILAAIGIYGLISFSVQQRVAEMGIRRALGGRAGTIVGMVLRQAALLAIIGIGIGLVGALFLGRFLQGMLYGVEATDPATLVTLVAVVLGVTALAALAPAYRATRIDPVEALRSE